MAMDGFCGALDGGFREPDAVRDTERECPHCGVKILCPPPPMPGVTEICPDCCGAIQE